MNVKIFGEIHMMKRLPLLLIIAGVLFLGFGGYQYFNTKQLQNESLEEAQQVLSKNNVGIGQSAKAASNILVADFKPEIGDVVGILEIPRIEAELPIVEGTDEDELEKGVGHYRSSAYPLQNEQIVLSGHRDTVFRKMSEVKIGDELIVKLPYGTFTYVIEGTKIVEADDTTIIKSTSPNEELVLTTCYPFSYVGNAPDRYIVTAKPKVD
jgi:sortase A